MAGKRKKSTVAKKVTVSELQSFIEGATAFNSDDWHPDKEQWTRIVEMIMTIKPDEPVSMPNEVPDNYPTRQTRPEQNTASSFQPSTFGDGEFVSTAQHVGDFNNSGSKAPRTDMRKIKPERTSGGGVDDLGISSSGIKVTTPNVDTSKGDYDTPFT